jgi:AI-2E family transporter
MTSNVQCPQDGQNRILLKLLLQPVVDFLCQKLRVPPAASALILILLVFGSIVVVGFSISVPASGWIQKASEVLPSLKDKLKVLRQPIDYMQQAIKEIEDVTAPGGNEPSAPTVKVREQSVIAASLAHGTLETLGRFFATMVILFFLLAAGDRLLRGFIEILPRFSDKQQAIDIAFEIQRSIGGYLLTITVMNSLVGVATGLAMWASGLGDPILWGTMAFLLNYVPILGSLTGIGIFLVAGILTLEGQPSLSYPRSSTRSSTSWRRDYHAYAFRESLHPEPRDRDRIIVFLARALGSTRSAVSRPLAGYVQDRCRPPRAAQADSSRCWSLVEQSIIMQQDIGAAWPLRSRKN